MSDEREASTRHTEGLSTAEEWGERAFHVRDPNGVIVQLVDSNAPIGTQH